MRKSEATAEKPPTWLGDGRETQRTELQQKLAAQPKTHEWRPMQSRIKIKLDPEKASDLIVTDIRFSKEHYVRAEILALGPYVGYEDIVVDVIDANASGTGDDGSVTHTVAKRKKLTDYAVGDKVLVNRAQVITYVSADGEEHTFLKNESFIVARLEPIRAN